MDNSNEPNIIIDTTDESDSGEICEPKSAKKESSSYTTMKKFHDPDAIKQAIDFARAANISHEKTVGIRNFFLSSVNHANKHISASTSVNILHRNDTERLARLDQISNLTSYYFDGKRGPAAEKNRRSTKLEIVSMISEPGSVYLGSFEPENNKGVTIGNYILEDIRKRNSEDTIRLLGMDGTGANSK